MWREPPDERARRHRGTRPAGPAPGPDHAPRLGLRDHGARRGYGLHLQEGLYPGGAGPALGGRRPQPRPAVPVRQALRDLDRGADRLAVRRMGGDLRRDHEHHPGDQAHPGRRGKRPPGAHRRRGGRPARPAHRGPVGRRVRRCGARGADHGRADLRRPAGRGSPGPGPGHQRVQPGLRLRGGAGGPAHVPDPHGAGDRARRARRGLPAARGRRLRGRARAVLADLAVPAGLDGAGPAVRRGPLVGPGASAGPGRGGGRRRVRGGRPA